MDLWNTYGTSLRRSERESEQSVEGAEQCIKEMNDELSMMMSFTGFSGIKELDASALWINGRRYQR